jgi:hypothetical protein
MLSSCRHGIPAAGSSGEGATAVLESKARFRSTSVQYRDDWHECDELSFGGVMFAYAGFMSHEDFTIIDLMTYICT